MSILNSFLDNVGQGLSRPKGNLGDFAHAARLYNDSAFRLAPKTKFLYHVVFNLNPDALAGTSFKEQHQTTVGLLVKQVDLPKFKISVDLVQQYNRKRAQQTKIDYEPINMTFHDDNLGVTTALWSLYYGYYYADSRHGGAAGAVSTGATGLGGIISTVANTLIPGVGKLFGRPSDTSGSSESGVPAGYMRSAIYNSDNTYRYGLDADQSVPFFTSIQIFQLSKQQYQSFTLVNPIITSWQHESLDNSNGSDPSANKMSIQYEAVIYGQGQVSTGTPTGFAQEFYDRSPSPLTLLGGGKVGLFGQGGILAGGVDVIGAIASGSAFSSAGALLGTLIKGAAVINNSKKITKEGLRQEGFNLLTGALSSATGVNVGGVANVLFPKSSGTGQTGDITAAVQTQITQGTGPLPPDKVKAFFDARPGALASLARTVTFAKATGGGTLTEINTRWNALSTAAKAVYEQQALQAVINGDPSVQSQYQLIKNQVIYGTI